MLPEQEPDDADNLSLLLALGIFFVCVTVYGALQLWELSQ